MKNPTKQLAGPQDPYRDDLIERLGGDGEPSGLFSRVKMILSTDRFSDVFEVCDDGNRVLYITKANKGWREVWLDD